MPRAGASLRARSAPDPPATGPPVPGAAHIEALRTVVLLGAGYLEASAATPPLRGRRRCTASVARARAPGAERDSHDRDPVTVAKLAGAVQHHDALAVVARHRWRELVGARAVGQRQQRHATGHAALRWQWPCWTWPARRRPSWRSSHAMAMSAAPPSHELPPAGDGGAAWMPCARRASKDSPVAIWQLRRMMAP